MTTCVTRRDIRGGIGVFSPLADRSSHIRHRVRFDVKYARVFKKACAIVRARSRQYIIVKRLFADIVAREEVHEPNNGDEPT